MGEKGSEHQPYLKSAGQWVIVIAVTGALATAAFTLHSLYGVTKSSPAPSSVAASGPPGESTVTALGRLEPRGEVIELSAPTSLQSARVAQLLVTEGDKVQINQVVAILDNRNRLQAALNKARQQVKVAQANLAKVRAGAKQGEIAAQKATVTRQEEELRGEITTQQATIERVKAQLEGESKAQQASIDRLKAELENAKTECDRFEQLFLDGVVTASERDRKCLENKAALERLNEAQVNLTRIDSTGFEQLKEAEASRDQTIATVEQQINQAKQTLNQIAEVRPVDIQEASAEVENTIASVGQAQADLELAYIRAPIAGQVLKVHTRPGETIDNRGIIELGQTNQMIVIAEVYESDIGKVRLGQKTTINSENNAFAGELRGTVNQIGLQIGKKDVLSTDPAADVDSRVVEVKIRLDAASAGRVAGFTNSKVVVKIYL